MFPYLQAESGQQYYPKLLLSDYEGSIEIVAGADPPPLREGAQRPGGGDGGDPGRHRRPHPRERGWLRPRRRELLQHLARRTTTPTPSDGLALHRGAGTHRRVVPGHPALRPAAKKAGPDLNRRSFVKAMAAITYYQGTVLPDAELRPEEVRRADRVPGGGAPQQRPPVAAVRASPSRASPRARAGTSSNRGPRW